MYEYKLVRKQVRKWVLEEKEWWTFQSEEKHMGQSHRLWEMIREQAMTKNNSICLFRKVKYIVSGGWVPLPSPLSSFYYHLYHHFHKYTCQYVYKTRQGCSLLPLSCNIVLQVIATTIREVIKGIHIGKEVKLFANDMIHIENLNGTTTKLPRVHQWIQ